MIKYTVKVNGLDYKIELAATDEISDIKEIKINGKMYKVDLDAENLSSIMLDNNTHKINGIYEFNGELVKLLIGKDYNKIELTEYTPIKRKGVSESLSKTALINAPMPGKIISLKVKQDETVEKDQAILILEAMKMENTVKSPRSGVIKSIKIKEGDSCNAGDALVIIE